jgi:hypothetical protein
MSHVLALALLLVGFSPAFTSPAPRVYDVIASSDFTPDQEIALEAAEMVWMNALPGELLLRRAAGPCLDTDPRAVAGSLICVAPLDSARMDALRLSGGIDGVAVGLSWRSRHDSGVWNIRIDVEALTDVVDQLGVEAHELGHAMGLHHDPQPFTLMFPSVSVCNAAGECRKAQSFVPTSSDIRAWRRLRVDI